MADSLVIVPTYNEIENIREIIAAIFKLSVPFHILIVDDGSPDGTGQVVKDLQYEHKEKLHLIERSGKLGLGTAYIAGFKYGLDHGYEMIYEMDADFSHKPVDLIRLREACVKGEGKLIIGSRYTNGGGVKNWPMDRLFLSRGASFYVQLVSWMPIKDPTGGFKCYHKDVLSAIDLDKIKFVGYAFQIEMKFAAWSLGFKLKEIPIIFEDRIRGTSKMNLSIIREAILGVLQLRIKTIFNPKRYAKKAIQGSTQNT